jgi:outer membrane assembly lipoprotein YfiO
MIKSLFLLVLTLVFLSGCSIFGSSKEIKKSPSDGLSPKVLYEIAQSKLEDGSIEKAIEQFEIILASYPRSKYAVQAQLDIAYNLYKQKKFNRSILKLDQFIEKYPNIPSTPYAYYLRGVVAEEKSSSILDKLITDSAQRDVESVRNAYGYYVKLIELFPNSKYSKDAIKKLVSLKKAPWEKKEQNEEEIVMNPSKDKKDKKDNKGEVDGGMAESVMPAIYARILEARKKPEGEKAGETASKGEDDFVKSHTDNIEVDDTEAKGHDDVSKAGRAGPSTKARPSDNMKGDKKVMPSATPMKGK